MNGHIRLSPPNPWTISASTEHQLGRSMPTKTGPTSNHTSIKEEQHCQAELFFDNGKVIQVVLSQYSSH